MSMSAATRYQDRLAAKRRAIHVARRQLDLDDTAYRAALMRAAGVKSSIELNTIDKADAVLDALAALGFIHKPRPRTVGRYPGTPHNLDRSAMLQKIEALLADMELPWAYAEAIAKRQSKSEGSIARLEWVPTAALSGIISALYNEKKKRLVKSRDALATALAERNLTPEWARLQAEEMGRLMQPWPWYECLETLRLVTARVSKE